MAKIAAPDQQKLNVFISYSRKDMAFADRLEAALKAEGIEPLIDRTEIYAFEDWWKRIQTLIGQADTVIFVLSPDAVASDVCKKEVAYAASLNKRFAPIVLRRVEDKAVPDGLARLNFIFFDDGARFEESLARLNEALKTDIGWLRRHTEFGQSARAWDTAKRPGGLVLRSPLLEEAERWIASRPHGAPAPTEETQAFSVESRRATTRRRNILTGSLAAGLMVALGLAGLAYWERGIAKDNEATAVKNEALAVANEKVAEEQRKIADQRREEAERNFKLAKGAADGLVFDIARGLRDVEGLRADSVRKILIRSETAFNRLLETEPNNPELLGSRAAMLGEFSVTYLAVGDIDAAAESARKAVAAAEALVARDPANADAQRNLALYLLKLADAATEKGDLNEARTIHERALEIRQKAAAQNPGDLVASRDVTVSLMRLGEIVETNGDLPRAKELFERALKERKVLIKARPEWQRDLTVSYLKLGDVELALGDTEGTRDAFEEGVANARHLAEEDHTSSRQLRDLAVALQRQGNFGVKTREAALATKAYGECLSIFQQLAASDPGNLEWSEDVAISRFKLGQAAAVGGDLGLAARDLTEALAERRVLLKKSPENHQLLTDIAENLIELATVAESGTEASLLEEAKTILIDLKTHGRTGREQEQWLNSIDVSLAHLR